MLAANIVFYFRSLVLTLNSVTSIFFKPDPKSWNSIFFTHLVYINNQKAAFLCNRSNIVDSKVYSQH